MLAVVPPRMEPTAINNPQGRGGVLLLVVKSSSCCTGRCCSRSSKSERSDAVPVPGVVSARCSTAVLLSAVFMRRRVKRRRPLCRLLQVFMKTAAGAVNNGRARFCDDGLYFIL